MVRKIAAVSFIIICVLLAGAAGMERYRQAQAAAEFPPPGRLVDIGGRKLQMDCRGTGSPTVVLESGGEDIFGSLDASNIHDAIAMTTRVCTYSRAGFMWSESRDSALEAESGARDLRMALSLAGELPPFVPVGYSRGALNVLIFTDVFGADVAATVFLDPRHPKLEARRAEAGVRDGGEESLTLARVARAVRWTGFPRLFADFCESEWYSPETIAACKSYFPHALDGIISEGKALDTVKTRAAAVTSLGNRPVLVLTRQWQDAWFNSDAAKRTAQQNSENLWRELHAEITAMSTQGEQRFVADSSHQFPYTHPQVVIDAVADIVSHVRTRSR